jgi:dUTP pyrophosphatase
MSTFTSNNLLDFIGNISENLKNKILNNGLSNVQSSKFAVLKLAVANNNLQEIYSPYIDSHNKYNEDNVYYNSGFDLFFPESTTFTDSKVKMVSMDVKAEMITCDAFSINTTCASYLVNSTCTGYYIYPRSSMSKTPLILANHTGVIDSGYRGNLIGAFKCFDEYPYEVAQHARLLQICHPELIPVYVILVSENELTTTQRGEGGFGSTGV